MTHLLTCGNRRQELKKLMSFFESKNYNFFKMDEKVRARVYAEFLQDYISQSLKYIK
jgi:hypothetical protein